MDRREAELETKTKKTESYEGSYPESRLRVSLLPPVPQESENEPALML